MDRQRPSIFLLARSLNIGGAERQLVHLAAGLQQRGHEVRVGLFYRGGALDEEIERCGIPIVDLGKSGRFDLAGFLLRTRAAIRGAAPEVVYSFLGTANVVAAMLRPTLPRFRMVWSIRASDMDPRSYDWAFRLNYALECALSRFADLIISNSEAGRDYATAHGFPRERIEVVPNGIDTERFRPDPALRAAKRREWGLGEGQIAIGVLARLDPMKDHPTFLRAAALIAPRAPQVRFVCVGEGPEAYRKDLLALSEELGLADRVLWTGRSIEPVAALNAVDLYCSSSAFGEGFSNAIAEAMACGLPCVVTRVGDSALLVGDAGRAVPPRDPRALADALLAELAGMDGNRSAGARARIVENFSLDLMVERTAALLAAGR